MEVVEEQEELWWLICTLCSRAFGGNKQLAELQAHKRLVHGSGSPRGDNVLILSQKEDLEPRIHLRRCRLQPTKSAPESPTAVHFDEMEEPQPSFGLLGLLEVDGIKCEVEAVEIPLIPGLTPADAVTSTSCEEVNPNRRRNRVKKFRWYSQFSALSGTDCEKPPDDRDADKARPLVSGSESAPEPPAEAQATTWRCPTCARQFNSRFNLLRHLRYYRKADRSCTTPMPKKFKCPAPECDALFRNRPHLQQHLINAHGPDSERMRHLCSICGQIYKSAKLLRAHLWRHKNPEHSSRPRDCPICGRTCHGDSGYRQHLQTHNPPTVLCQLCGLQFKSEQLLKTHKLVRHSEATPFVCPHCPRAFKLRYRMLGHVRRYHSEGTPYPCTLCPVAFKVREDLTKHRRRVHDPSMRRICPVCEQVFTCRESLARHQIRKHGEPGRAAELREKMKSVKGKSSGRTRQQGGRRGPGPDQLEMQVHNVVV